MNDRNDREKIQIALDTTFSNLKDDPWLAQRVLAKAKGEVKVKKKLSAGLILAIVLVLVAVSALALVLSDVFFHSAGQLQDEKGNLSQWTLEDKIGLIQTMQDSSIKIAAEKYCTLTDAITSAEEAARLADEILVDSKFARAAFAAKHGFTSDTFSIFAKTVAFSQDAATPSQSKRIVTYTPLQYADPIGRHEVQAKAATGRILSATWIYDDHDTTGIQPGDWSATIWPVRLVNRLLPFQEEYISKRKLMEEA